MFHQQQQVIGDGAMNSGLAETALEVEYVLEGLTREIDDPKDAQEEMPLVCASSRRLRSRAPSP